VDFKELKNAATRSDAKKNRVIMLALLGLFVLPVIIAYVAYFNGLFVSATKNRGELLSEQNVADIEDFLFLRADGNVISGKEFETLYWWLLPIDSSQCDDDCLKLNVYTVNQTYLGLGKKSERINQLLVLPTGSKIKIENFPIAFSTFTNIGVKALENAQKGINKDLPANFIYLTDPLGNIFMRYPLVRNKAAAPQMSKD